MAQQLTFDLPSRTALGRDDFFVSDSNSVAVGMIDGWESWPSGKLLLAGGTGSGKTHLCHVWAAQSGATIADASDLGAFLASASATAGIALAIEDIDRIAGDRDAEEALFHLHNAVLAGGGRLLMTCSDDSAKFTLPDLESRIRATTVAAITPADDALLAAIMVKLFADRQLHVKLDVISYLISHMERSFAAANRLVAALDAAALTQKRAVTRPLAVEILKQLQMAKD